ncbi:MAG: carbohydrate kinase, partial [Saprospiraceae bacterium]
MILILDIGKTNKKCFVFDEDYRIVFERSTQLPETVDEDGEPCEDLALLKN